ncbi:Ribosome assembly protein 4 [Penicillium diatomitis]|uniref:Ribosome assembly protein 4 n=1 Tax=Penicillium diatomitis TaxID=2819901 RepID=A0A9W9XJ15_9EURO|nr:Ribosome assembly protein 4 [Penicillium diatomitis]KAJ5493445.1 Ribosome assembly protein 4 [Penicillium diatomitis]
MATLLPPPSKRQKLAQAEKAREQQEIQSIPTDLGSIRVQFFDQATGNATGPAVSVPVADANIKNLETLLNTLQGNEDDDRVPYRFTYQSDKKDGQTIDILADLYHSLLQPGIKTTEDTVPLFFTPQAVFRVKAVSRCAASIAGHGEAILATQFSPVNSSTMVSGSGDSTARIWDCDTGTPLHTLKGHTSWVLAVAYSPNGAMIATGSMDNSVRFWDAKKGEALGAPVKGHSKWITSLAWEPYHLQESGRPRLASASKDSTVRIWDVVSKRIEHVLTGHKGSVTCVRWGGTGQIYTASHDKTIKIWNPKDGTLIQTLAAHAHRVNHLALSTDFALRTAYHDHTGQTPATETERVAAARKRFEDAATVNNKIVERLVSASDDFTMYLWDPSTSNKPVARMLGHQKEVNHVTFSPDMAYIASAGFDNHVKLWNGRDGKYVNSFSPLEHVFEALHLTIFDVLIGAYQHRFITTFRGHVGAVYQCCFSADSRMLVSSSKDTTLKVWDVRTGKLATDLPGHQDEVFAVDWSPDGQKVGSGGKDKAIRIWRN